MRRVLLFHIWPAVLHGFRKTKRNRTREVAITSVRKPNDPNEEVLQWLQCVELAKTVYKPPFLVSLFESFYLLISKLLFDRCTVVLTLFACHWQRNGQFTRLGTTSQRRIKDTTYREEIDVSANRHTSTVVSSHGKRTILSLNYTFACMQSGRYEGYAFTQLATMGAEYL